MKAKLKGILLQAAEKCPGKDALIFRKFRNEYRINGFWSAAGRSMKYIFRRHWTYWDAPKAHLQILGRRVLKLFGMAGLNKKMKAIADIKDRHAGERCFIACTGPSLKVDDLEKLKNEYSFSMNTIFLAYESTEWRPTYYVFVDPYTCRKLSKHYTLDFESFAIGEAFLHSYIRANRSDRIKPCLIHYGNHTKRNMKKGRVKIEDDVSVCIYDCFTVTNMAMTIAIYMGFREIYLLGCDCNYEKAVHFQNSEIDPTGEEEGRMIKEADLNRYGYEAMREYAEKKGVKIFNATRGGYLETFERVDFDNIEFRQ